MLEIYFVHKNNVIIMSPFPAGAGLSPRGDEHSDPRGRLQAREGQGHML